jgi:hypothetical protein
MSLKRKGFLEGHKKVAGDKLVTRMSSLKEKGLDAVAIKRDSFIKKMRADIRKANYRLACIAAQEKLNAEKNWLPKRTPLISRRQRSPRVLPQRRKRKKKRKRHLLLRMSKSRNRLFIRIFIDPCQLIVTSDYHG